MCRIPILIRLPRRSITNHIIVVQRVMRPLRLYIQIGQLVEPNRHCHAIIGCGGVVGGDDEVVGDGEELSDEGGD